MLFTSVFLSLLMSNKTLLLLHGLFPFNLFDLFFQSSFLWDQLSFMLNSPSTSLFGINLSLNCFFFGCNLLPQSFFFGFLRISHGLASSLQFELTQLLKFLNFSLLLQVLFILLLFSSLLFFLLFLDLLSSQVLLHELFFLFTNLFDSINAWLLFLIFQILLLINWTE